MQVVDINIRFRSLSGNFSMGGISPCGFTLLSFHVEGWILLHADSRGGHQRKHCFAAGSFHRGPRNVPGKGLLGDTLPHIGLEAGRHEPESIDNFIFPVHNVPFHSTSIMIRADGIRSSFPYLYSFHSSPNRNQAFLPSATQSLRPSPLTINQVAIAINTRSKAMADRKTSKKFWPMQAQGIPKE